MGPGPRPGAGPGAGPWIVAWPLELIVVSHTKETDGSLELSNDEGGNERQMKKLHEIRKSSSREFFTVLHC